MTRGQAGRTEAKEGNKLVDGQSKFKAQGLVRQWAYFYRPSLGGRSLANWKTNSLVLHPIRITRVFMKWSSAVPGGGIPKRVCNTGKAIKVLAFALLLATSSWVSAQPNPFLLTSSADGNGLFTYTFSPGDANFVMGMYSNNGNIYMPSHGVVSVTSPTGWTATVDNDVVIWSALSTTPVYLGSPSLVFSIQSSSTQPVLYDTPLGPDPYSRGAVVGGVHFLNPIDQQSDGEGSVGFLTFSFIGPAVIPEPSSGLLVFLGGLIILSSRRTRPRTARLDRRR